METALPKMCIALMRTTARTVWSGAWAMRQ